MSTNANSSANDDTIPSSSISTYYIIVGVSTVMFVVIATVNILTLVALATTPQLRTIPNMYVASLAMSDVLVSTNQIVTVTWLHPDLHGYFETSQTLCLFVKCWSYVPFVSSIATVVLVAVDRFVYIIYPLFYLRVVTRAKTIVILVVTWMFCVVFTLCVRMLTAGKDFEGCGLLAVLFESQSTGYLHSLIFLLVHTALCLLYGFILRVAFKQARAVGAYDHFRNTTNDVSMTSAEHVTQARVVEARLKLKAVLRMGGVFVMSFVCWTPYAIVCLTGPQKASREVMLTTFYLISFNSAGNFCIYALADREFRAALAKMLRLAASDRNSASANSGSIDLAAP